MDKTVDEDLPLVQRAQTGDFSAMEALAKKYERRVFGLARRILGQHQDAEEVVQQTFVSVIEHLEAFREESLFRTWLMRIATNHALGLLRKRARRSTVPLGEDRSDENYSSVPHPQYIAVWRETPEQIANQRETARHIQEALETLDEKYRLVFLLRDVEGLSTQETAEALGISVANAKVRLLRARLMLRERLTHLFGDEATQLEPHRHDEEDVG